MPTSVPSAFRYQRLRRRVLLGVTLVILLIVGLVSWQIASSYLAAKNSARAQVESFVHAIDAHVAHSLELVDLSLIGFAQSIGVMPLAQRNSADAINSLLLAQGAGVSRNFRVLYIDAQGKGIATGINLPVGNATYADRDYFQAHVLLDQGRFVGTPLVGRISGTRMFPISRRVQDPTGKFLGVIVALMDASAFAKVFDSARFNEDMLVTLVHRNGHIIARSPEFVRSFNLSLSQSNLFKRLQHASSGVYEGPSSLDTDNHIYSYQTVAHMPLVVSIGISSHAWNSTLVRNLAWGLTGIALVIGLLLSSARLALRAYQRLARSESNYRLLYTEIQQTEQKLASSEHRLRTITDNVPALITYIDPLHVLRFCNGTFQEWVGQMPQDLIDRPIKEIMGEEQYQLHRQLILRALAGERVSVDTNVRLKGVPQCLQTIYVPDRLADGSVVGIYTLSTDVTELKEKEQLLEQMARYDALTGLPNRRELNTRLADAIHRSQRSGLPLNVMFLDIDHFKSINDQHGHATGDAVLQEFSRRLQASLRSTDTVARLAGDEFVILLEQTHTATDACTVAAKILAAMQPVMHTAAAAVQVSTSIGICHARTLEKSAEELLSLADEALYEAKAAGRNNYVLKQC